MGAQARRCRAAFDNGADPYAEPLPDTVAAFATAASAAVMAFTASSTSRPCRFASQLGSLYESHVTPEASCQTNAFSGRSMPIVCTDCITGVPALALPKIKTSVGRSDSPAAAAPAV